MAKILRFTLPKGISPQSSEHLESKFVNLAPIKAVVVINNGTKSHIARFPEAWQPFIRWPDSQSTRR